MPVFAYEGRDQKGFQVSGEITAEDMGAAANELMSRQILPINISPQTEKGELALVFRKLFARKLTTSELALFSRQMHALCKAGVPVLSAIQQLSQVSSVPILKHALIDIAKQVGLGEPVSKAMQKFPALFPPLMIALVSTGEANGRIDDAFLQASQYYELASTTRKRIKTALRYPLTVVVVTFLAVIGLNAFIIPKFAALYARFESQLPLPTRLLIGLSTITRDYWWLILLVVALLVFIVRIFFVTERYRAVIDHIILVLPIFGDIMRRIVMTNFTRTLGILIHTNVPLLEAIRLVAEVVNNVYAKKKILKMQAFIEQGDNLSTAANKINLFSPLILQMLSVGDTTGNMDKMLFEVSAFYEQEIDYDIKQLTDKIEPILIVIVGAIVLTLALGIFLPMWNMVYVVH
ncbi:MAG: hypothetical protein A3E84_00350 [Gammaproteobacteria bacterium RIFCSPHIGHO2_12_FULL_42_13]|nr:MAG: hypothetical protein A3E84_00350 [Gammaproteobacteria bacterium RIFCSPHIGHO2_12_FULL_42_13]